MDKSTNIFKAVSDIIKPLPLKKFPAVLSVSGKMPLNYCSHIKIHPKASAKPPPNNAPIGANIGAKGPVNDRQEMHPNPPPIPANMARDARLWYRSLPQVY